MAANLIDKARFINKQTGFAIKDCMEVLKSAQMFDSNMIMAGEPIKYGKLFTIKPVKIPATNKYDLNNHKMRVVPEHYRLSLTEHNLAKECLNMLNEKALNDKEG